MKIIDVNSHKVRIDVNCLSNKEKEELLNALRPKGQWIATEYSDKVFPRVRCSRCGNSKTNIVLYVKS